MILKHILSTASTKTTNYLEMIYKTVVSISNLEQ